MEKEVETEEEEGEMEEEGDEDRDETRGAEEAHADVDILARAGQGRPNKPNGGMEDDSTCTEGMESKKSHRLPYGSRFSLSEEKSEFMAAPAQNHAKIVNP